MASNDEKKLEVNTENDNPDNPLMEDNPILDQEVQVEEPKKKRFVSYYGIILALLSAIFLSISNVLTKKANFFSGTDIGLMRFFVQFVIMFVIALSTRTNFLGPKEKRKTLLLLGFINTFVTLFLFISIKFIQPSETSALFQLNMIFVPIMARFFLKEKFRLIFITSLIMSIVGVFFIAQPSFLFKQNKDLNNTDLNLTSNPSAKYTQAIGISTAILGALCGALSFVITRSLAQLKVHYSVVIVYQSFIGTPIAVLISLAMFYFGIQKYDMRLVQDAESILIQVASGIGSGFFGALLQIAINLAVKYEETLKVSMIYSNSLLFTFLFQFLILNINTNLFSTLGALLIFLSTLMIIFIQMLEKKTLRVNNNQTVNQSEIAVPSWKKYLFFKI